MYDSGPLCRDESKSQDIRFMSTVAIVATRVNLRLWGKLMALQAFLTCRVQKDTYIVSFILGVQRA